MLYGHSQSAIGKNGRGGGERIEAIAPLHSVSSICRGPNVIRTRPSLRIHSFDFGSVHGALPPESPWR